MAFNDIEIANIKRCMEFFMEKRRPAEHLRDELDLSYSIEDDYVVIFEVRRLTWSDGQAQEPIAKITHDKSNSSWSLFWMDKDSNWHNYDEIMLGSFSDAIRLVEDDARGCFFG
ncbi:DUF3024 domain-containing protein [Providencia sp. PROV119]|uniref:DUF3024 domain-containing protein n=1 Tax=Providencia sp. PROV119 TaxID=2949830 RepID=UPI0023495FF8|nr:DUF3024 domain-containing protein [Providencia sp. PROV119]